MLTAISQWNTSCRWASWYLVFIIDVETCFFLLSCPLVGQVIHVLALNFSIFSVKLYEVTAKDRNTLVDLVVYLGSRHFHSQRKRYLLVLYKFSLIVKDQLNFSLQMATPWWSVHVLDVDALA